MKKLRSQHYLLLILSVLALVVAALAYVFMYDDATRKAVEEANVQAAVLAASKQTTEAENMETAYNDTVADRARLPAFLVSKEDVVPFIDTVEAIGPTTGASVSISSLSSGTNSGSSHAIVTASISVAGAWANVMRAIETVEDLPYAISINSIHLDASPADSLSLKSSPRWAAAMNISALSSP